MVKFGRAVGFVIPVKSTRPFATVIRQAVGFAIPVKGMRPLAARFSDPARGMRAIVAGFAIPVRITRALAFGRAIATKCVVAVVLRHAVVFSRPLRGGLAIVFVRADTFVRALIVSRTTAAMFA